MNKQDGLGDLDTRMLKKFKINQIKYEKRVRRYMNNIIKHNIALIYHNTKTKAEFTKQCKQIFSKYNKQHNNANTTNTTNTTNINAICNELYNILDNIQKTTPNKRTSNKTTPNKRTNKLTITNSLQKTTLNKATKKRLHGGDVKGPYLQRLTTKGSEPITGDDMAKVIEEITMLLDDVQYLDDAPNVKGFNALLKYFNGDPEGIKAHVRYSIGPQFYSTFPPTINFTKIYERWDNIVDILNAYKHDRKIKLQFAVDKGLKPEDVLKPSFLDKFAENLDTLDQKFQKAKQVRRGSYII